MNLLRPAGPASDYAGGRIERIDPASGAVTVLYDRCGPHKLLGPNDIVFDGLGGFYFTDLGKARARDRDWGGVYYALADGSKIVEVVHPILTPNGIGLSPDGKTLYVAETETARLWAFDVMAPGVLGKAPFPSPHGGRLMVGLGGFQRFDSLAVDGAGNICVATLVNGSVSVVQPGAGCCGRFQCLTCSAPTSALVALAGARRTSLCQAPGSLWQWNGMNPACNWLMRRRIDRFRKIIGN